MDLGATPLANDFLSPVQPSRPEVYYPLRVFLCPKCALVQLEAIASPEAVFEHYAYFSSFSTTLLRHSKAFAAAAVARLQLQPSDLVAEVASNDGYLLQHFRAYGMTVLGIEPAKNIAAVAEERGVPTVARFFGAAVARELAADGHAPRLIVANNVAAHVPDLNDFLAGMSLLLPAGGTLSFEFHHLLSLVEQGQFDTIYHEHFQYLSLHTFRTALAAHGLAVVDVEELTTQGGSLRVYARHASEARAEPTSAVCKVLAREHAARLERAETYHALGRRAFEQKLALLTFLIEAKRAGKAVTCFGAAAKGNTLLNCCGVQADLVEYVVDSNTHKQGCFLPGSRIPIYGPERVAETRPDYLVILPWNLRDEVVGQMAHIREWGGRFVVPSPELRVIE